MSENDLLGIVKKPAFEVVIAREIETTSENGQSLFDILPMWEEFNWSDDYFPLTELASDGRVPVIGAKNMGIVVFKAGTPKFTYSIAVEKAKQKLLPAAKPGTYRLQPGLCSMLTPGSKWSRPITTSSLNGSRPPVIGWSPGRP